MEVKDKRAVEFMARFFIKGEHSVAIIAPIPNFAYFLSAFWGRNRGGGNYRTLSKKDYANISEKNVTPNYAAGWTSKL